MGPRDANRARHVQNGSRVLRDMEREDGDSNRLRREFYEGGRESGLDRHKHADNDARRAENVGTIASQGEISYHRKKRKREEEPLLPMRDTTVSATIPGGSGKGSSPIILIILSVFPISSILRYMPPNTGI